MEAVRAHTTVVGRFKAMACPCEVIVDTADDRLGLRLVDVAEREARRIEEKFSRYIPGNALDRINRAEGKPFHVDEEMAQLLDFAARAFELSGGLFDVTSGVLRRAWKFDGSNAVPAPETVEKLRAFVGWRRAAWDGRTLKLEPGMELDLGGIAKEYAVDRAVALIAAESGAGVLVNFGGDIAAGGHRRNGAAWSVGIEQVDDAGKAAGVLQLKRGAVATSGDSKRFVTDGRRRYGHIIDPRTGWPVADAPRAVTVHAATCTEAGFLSTMGMLSGREAETFLRGAGEKFWVAR